MVDELLPLLWIDLETTGLDPSREVILEVAAVLTTPALDDVFAYTSPVFAGAIASRDMHPVVVEMHTKNGLFAEVVKPGTPDLAHVLASVESKVREHTSGRVMLAGSSVHFDRGFLAHHAPAWVERFFSHRHLDVSVLHRAAEMWRPEARYVAPSDTAAHRALPDIRHSIDATRHYRRVFASISM